VTKLFYKYYLKDVAYAYAQLLSRSGNLIQPCRIIWIHSPLQGKLPANQLTKAARGSIARDEIIVATVLDESCTPFRKSNVNARTIKMISAVDIYEP